MESNSYDRLSELKAFDATKKGVKGLSDATIPRFFHHPSLPDATIPAAAAAAVPTIDLRRPIEDLVPEIRAAAVEWGFFQVVGHGVPQEAMDGMIGGVRRFFEEDAEEETRKELYIRDLARKVRWNANFDLYSSRMANWRDTLAVMMAPDPPAPEEIPQSCREAIIEYEKHVAKLGELLFELLSQGLGLKPSHLKDMKCSEGHFLLSHYYPPCPQPELTIGTSPHSDNNFLTVLLQDQLGGLQILHDNQWVDVSPLPGGLVVNIGDLLQLISNDKYMSVEHQVLANKKGPRISVAFFFNTHFSSSSDVLYGPIKELLSEDNPPLYRETLARDYASHYYTRGLSGKAPLADYRIRQPVL